MFQQQKWKFGWPWLPYDGDGAGAADGGSLFPLPLVLLPRPLPRPGPRVFGPNGTPRPRLWPKLSSAGVLSAPWETVLNLETAVTNSSTSICVLSLDWGTWCQGHAGKWARLAEAKKHCYKYGEQETVHKVTYADCQNIKKNLYITEYYGPKNTVDQRKGSKKGIILFSEPGKLGHRHPFLDTWDLFKFKATLLVTAPPVQKRQFKVHQELPFWNGTSDLKCKSNITILRQNKDKGITRLHLLNASWVLYG